MGFFAQRIWDNFHTKVPIEKSQIWMFGHEHSAKCPFAALGRVITQTEMSQILKVRVNLQIAG